MFERGSNRGASDERPCVFVQGFVEADLDNKRDRNNNKTELQAV